MTSVLLSFVGDHDPGDAAPDMDGILKDGPLPSIIRYLLDTESSLNRVVLFYTVKYLRDDGQEQPGMEQRWEQTCERIAALDSTIAVDSVPLKINPAREEEVLPVVLQWLEDHPFAEDDEIHVNLASGTGAMRSVWTFLVDARLLPGANVWNSLNPNMPFMQGQRVYKVGLSYLNETRHIYTAAGLMKGMAFAEASNALKSISEEQVTTQRVERTKLWQAILDVYALWDRAFYEEANRRFNDIRGSENYSLLPQQIREILEAQAGVLEQAAVSRTHPKSLPILLDVYASQSRRIIMRQYPNVATRTRRIIEGCVRYAMGQDLENPNASASASAAALIEPKGGASALINDAEKHIRSYGKILFAERKETWGITPSVFAFNTEQLRAIRDVYQANSENLNMSIEVHGFRSPKDADNNPKKGQVGKLVSGAQACLSIICHGRIDQPIPAPETLVFGSETIVQLADRFRDWV